MPSPSKKYTPEKRAERAERAERVEKLMSAAPTSANLIATSLFIREIVKQEKRAHEPRLVDACWVEYAYMTPLQRTAAFTIEYLRVYRVFYGKYISTKDAPFQNPIEAAWAANEPGDMARLWFARQYADELGMPYPIYLSHAFEFMAIKEAHKRFPRPNQLYDSPTLIHLEVAWAEYPRSSCVRIGEWDKRFHVVNYTGDPAQKRLHDQVIERILSKPGSLDINIRGFVLNSQPTLPIAVAAARLGAEAVESEVRRMGTLPAQPVPGAAARYLRPCIGVAYNLDPVICKTCELAAPCGRVSTEVDRLALAAHGDTEPKRAAKKEGARLRQQKSRAGKRDREGLGTSA